MTTAIDTQRLERLYAAAEAAVLSFGKGGDERCVRTVASLFAAGASAPTFLDRIKVKNAKGNEVNLPSHRILVLAAWTSHVMSVDADTALELARTIGQPLFALVNKPNTSVEVRQEEIDRVYEGRLAERSARAAESARVRASIRKQAPALVTALTKAAEQWEEGETLDPETAEMLDDIVELIAQFRA